jgi:hypothetical protein
MIYLIAKFRFWKLFIKCFHITRCSTPVLKITQPGGSVASSDNWGMGHIHIFVFTDLKNNRFQKKLIMQNKNI